MSLFQSLLSSLSFLACLSKLRISSLSSFFLASFLSAFILAISDVFLASLTGGSILPSLGAFSLFEFFGSDLGIGRGGLLLWFRRALCYCLLIGRVSDPVNVIPAESRGSLVSDSERNWLD
jgi:hypothetical protein